MASPIQITNSPPKESYREVVNKSEINPLTNSNDKITLSPTAGKNEQSLARKSLGMNLVQPAMNHPARVSVAEMSSSHRSKRSQKSMPPGSIID